MFDFYKEKADILSKLGSFYYKILNKDSNNAKLLSHLAFQTDIICKLRGFVDLIQGNKVLYDGYNKVIKFSDKDITCICFDENGTIIEQITPGSSIHDDFKQFSLKFRVKVPENMYITSLNVGAGQYLFNNVHFKSGFGYIEFTENPITVVKNMQLFARHYKYKKRNVMSYPLGLQEVYGDVSHITEFYKNNQSLKQFKAALYRSIGFPIVLKDSVIKQVVGDVYIDSYGNEYNCSFEHKKINVGDIVLKDTVLGNEDILKVYLPDEQIPNTLVKLYPVTSSVSKDSLYLTNKKGNPYSNWVYNPNAFFDGDSKQAYSSYVTTVGAAVANDTIKSLNINFINSVDFIRDIVAPGRCIIIYINKNKISEYILLRLKSFILDNLPIGAVVLLAEDIKDLQVVSADWEVDQIDLDDPSDLYTQNSEGVELESLNINTDDGLTVAVRVNWTGVSAAPLLWVSTQDGESYSNSVGTIGWKANAHHAGLFNTSGSSNSATDEFNAYDYQDKQVYIPDFIYDQLSQYAKNNSLKDKQLVYFITSKNGESRLYELTNDNSIQLLSMQGHMAQGVVKFLTVGHWNMETPRQTGNATVQIFKGIMSELQMLKAAQLLL